MATRSFSRMNLIPPAVLCGAFAIWTALMPGASAPQGSAAPAAAPQGAGARDQGAPLADADARAILGTMAGTWRVAGTSYDANGQPDSQLSGTAAWGWTLGGLFLEGEQVLTNGNMMLHSIEYMGYSPGAGAFQRTQFTDRDPATFLSKGLWDPTSRRLTLRSENVAAPDGAGRRVQNVIDLSTKGTIVWETVFLTGAKGEETPVGTVRLTMTQMAGTPAGTPGGLATGGGGPGAMPSVPMGAAASPADIQKQLDGILQQKLSMQKQIEGYRQQMQKMSGTMRKITE